MATYHDKEKICWESGAVVALTRNMADGTYCAYFPFAILTEASQMRRYHSKEKICCQKGAECNTRQKYHRWVVLGVRPIGGIFC